MKVQFQIETTLEIDDEMEVPDEIISRGYEAVWLHIGGRLRAGGTHGLNIVGERVDRSSLNLYGEVLKAFPKRGA